MSQRCREGERVRSSILVMTACPASDCRTSARLDVRGGSTRNQLEPHDRHVRCPSQDPPKGARGCGQPAALSQGPVDERLDEIAPHWVAARMTWLVDEPPTRITKERRTLVARSARRCWRPSFCAVGRAVPPCPNRRCRAWRGPRLEGGGVSRPYVPIGALQHRRMIPGGRAIGRPTRRNRSRVSRLSQASKRSPMGVASGMSPVAMMARLSGMRASINSWSCWSSRVS